MLQYYIIRYKNSVRIDYETERDERGELCQLTIPYPFADMQKILSAVKENIEEGDTPETNSLCALLQRFEKSIAV